MQKKSLSRYWLIIGVTALAIAGLYSLVLAGGRSPKIGSSPFLGRIFHEALVVHVDLSVLVWFLAIACLLWSLMSKGSRSVIPYIEEAALWCFALGTAAITLSPLDPTGSALMSNYIPVIYSPVFFIGLTLIGCGTVLMLCKLIGAHATTGLFNKPQQFALLAAGIITAIAMAAFYWSFHQMPAVIDGQQYYDMVFWGGGHILQFTHTQILMVAWLMLIVAVRPVFSLSDTMLYGLFSIGLLAAFSAPLPYILFDITSQEHRNFFTHQMIMGGGIAPMLLAIAILPALWQGRAAKKGNQRALWSALFMSLVLFIYGGVLGGMIQGQNVVIPAHYHGSIVGVTLAFMGLAYLLMPKLGYRDVAGNKWAYWQPYIYGVGQLMHVSGFAWSGGYGALRKTPGGTYEGAAKVAMALMGTGAGLAAIGGVIFVIVIAKAMLAKEKN